MTLSLERALQERVGLQEKDLLRSQLEAERDAHRAALAQTEELRLRLAELAAEADNYKVRPAPPPRARGRIQSGFLRSSLASGSVAEREEGRTELSTRGGSYARGGAIGDKP